MIFKYKIDPFPAVRSNRNSWSDKTKEYHAKMDKLRLFVRKDIQTLIDSLISGNYRIIFNIKMPDSWSKKKKEEFLGKQHRSKPDIDNLYKGFTDSIFYLRKENDSEISEIYASKVWSDEGSIEIII